MDKTAALDGISANDALIPDDVLRDEANFIQNMSQFYNKEDLSDIILLLDDVKYFAHKFVLAKSSDVFRTMLYEKKWENNSNHEIELQETAECKLCFDKFLRYLYTAEVAISKGTAVGILCLADKYNVTSLKDLCVTYMAENSQSPNVEMALSWYPWAKALHLPSLIDHCAQTVHWNFSQVISGSSWLFMEREFLIDFLHSSELVIRNEFVLWAAVCSWLLHENQKEHLRENAQEILPLMRLPQMPVSQLYEVEQSELASHEDCSSIFNKLLSQAYRFHALCPYQNSLADPPVHFSDDVYKPREYTELTVDCVRIQNALRFGIQVDVKMFRGPVPQDSWEADWKITYRKQTDTWQLQFFCHDSGLINSEARFQPSIIVYNEDEQVVQVHREAATVISRGQSLSIQIILERPDISRTMAVLLKPVAF